MDNKDFLVTGNEFHVTTSGIDRWSYEWDAENRLKAMQTLPVTVAAGVPAQRLEFAYTRREKMSGVLCGSQKNKGSYRL